MTTIQTALGEIEKQVERNKEIEIANLDDVERWVYVSRNPGNIRKVALIRAAAILVRLISELPDTKNTNT